jgi:carboxymethylenebutenolidase
MADVLRDGLERLKAEMGPGAVIGAWGFCMGGGAALQGACTSPFAFCVDYYGRIDDAGEVRGLSGPLLLILGSEDDRLNPWVYGDLLPRLDEHRKRVHVDLYPGVAHAFHREGWPPYDKAAASEAWVHAVEFARNAGR